MENMDENQLFSGMFKDDQEGQKLLLVPGADELMAQFEQKFQSLVQAMFELGLKVSRESSGRGLWTDLSLRRKRREITRSKTFGSA